jgi:hypothetical protein
MLVVQHGRLVNGHMYVFGNKIIFLFFLFLFFSVQLHVEQVFNDVQYNVIPIEQQICISANSALCSTIRWSTGPWDDVNNFEFCFSIFSFSYLISVQQHVVQVFNNVVFIVMIHHVLGFVYQIVNV